MADELIDILNRDGKPTGEVRLKSEAHRLGLYHASVHIWFYTLNGNILLQKRATDKDTFPNLWDISVAGHIGAGETVENSVLREIEEEIGVSTSKKNLNFIGMYLSEKQPTPEIFDNEFHYIFLSELKVSTEELILQKEEVSEIKLMSIKLLTDHLHNIDTKKNYVPHDTQYYDFVLKEITNRLT
ncbi:NUDIX domain-containing protein [uncultured Aquimarina sp.]|jgi:isopentenyldiphosphate isomerase|uniref:NUDIX hydrolase n=1 Tax=uncultured Aquimarina sp. TaxID=575652 RepID=UPI00262C7F92|nr:NUDIX domain-containing protein [uncultured Aquimarina sp.]